MEQIRIGNGKPGGRKHPRARVSPHGMEVEGPTQSFEASPDQNLITGAVEDTQPDESDCRSWHEQVVDGSEAELAKMYARARQGVELKEQDEAGAREEGQGGIYEQDELALDPRGLHERYAHLLERGWTDWPIPVVAPW